MYYPVMLTYELALRYCYICKNQKSMLLVLNDLSVQLLILNVSPPNKQSLAVGHLMSEVVF